MTLGEYVPTYLEVEPLPCGCALLKGRCRKHGDMMTEIHEAWSTGSEHMSVVIWALQDGYGEPGTIPEQGYDWSGIRDSSIEAVEEMYRAIHA